MERKEAVEIASGNLDSLVPEALLLLKRLGYSEVTQRHCKDAWAMFANFAKTNGGDDLTEKLIEEFLVYYQEFTRVNERKMMNIDRVRSKITMLIEFHLHGCWQANRVDRVAAIPSFPDSLGCAFQQFMLYWKNEKMVRQYTLTYARRYLTTFLRFSEANHVVNISDLTTKTLSDFIASQSHRGPQTLKSLFYVLRAFLRYLYLHEFIAEDLSLRVPSIRIPMEQHLPSIWSEDEITSLLAAVDRGSPMGKRDYVMLLLACRLGMRATDIRKLKLDNVIWEESCIKINQNKTGNPLALPLTEEVGEAIIDYLRNGRPPSQHREIFLRACAPMIPLSNTYCFYDMIAKYRKQAGISLTSQKKRGSHSLRHTVACRLLQSDVSLETISEIMGHASMETTRTYARVGIEKLRDAAIDPEEVFSNA